MPSEEDDWPPACTAFDPNDPPNYGYTPSLPAGIVFIVLFALIALAHTIQLVLSRRWWLLVFVLGAVGELLGWIGRTWAHACPYSITAFQLQISTLIFSPAFFAAGIYIVLGYLIRIFGPAATGTLLTPKQYLWVFCSVDFCSLLLQAIGGGLASSASSEEGGDLRPGTDTMVVGIVFQLVSNVVFAGLFARALAKTYKVGKGILNVDSVVVDAPAFLDGREEPSWVRRRPATTTERLRVVAAATAVSTLCLIARGVYRSIELIQGWRGHLILTERYFLGLDGALMAIAGGVFVFANPHWLLPHKAECPEFAIEGQTQPNLLEKCFGKKGEKRKN
ncbi:MAG: hypothetical protein LQ342_002241 [Letrouitia transgressa]|nr:MAG: hypothetical protein LQ342_002241 [Letrouitia transgressa]